MGFSVISNKGYNWVPSTTDELGSGKDCKHVTLYCNDLSWVVPQKAVRGYPLLSGPACMGVTRALAYPPSFLCMFSGLGGFLTTFYGLCPSVKTKKIEPPEKIP